MSTKPSFFTLLIMISFASVNAVLFTPGLPSIANFFLISETGAQQTLTWFLVGYAIGQLIYGPIANRFGRKPALYACIIVQIVSCYLCVLAGHLNNFSLLMVGRFFSALGSGVGLKMTFTLVNESFDQKIASQKTAYLMLAFAVAPGLAVAIGGLLNARYGWVSCFYAGAFYGLFLLFRVRKLPETLVAPDYDALKLSRLISAYHLQFKNKRLVAGGLLMGGATCFFYLFAAVAPFLAIDLSGMSSRHYGFANVLPPVGLIAGLLISAQLAKATASSTTMIRGLIITAFGTLIMLFTTAYSVNALLCLFLPMTIIYFGLSMIMANASVLALSQVSDKSHGSAVMSFINMSTATLMVLLVGVLPMNHFLLPTLFAVICASMFYFCNRLTTRNI